MKKYLAEIFGLSVKIENWDGKSKLPLYLRNKREYFVLSIGNVQSILMKNSSDNFNVSGFEKEMWEIEKYSGMSVILWLEAISTYQRNALVKNRLSVLRDGGNNGNEIRKNNGNLGDNAEARVHITVPLNKY